METLEGNKLIMFFDGAESSKIEILGKWIDSIKYKGTYYPDWNLPTFNEDWNLLMPVVEKMRKVAFELWDSNRIEEKIWMEVSVWGNQVKFVDEETGEYPICNPIEADTLLAAIWQAVVEFIKWYNTTLNP